MCMHAISTSGLQYNTTMAHLRKRVSSEGLLSVPTIFIVAGWQVTVHWEDVWMRDGVWF